MYSPHWNILSLTDEQQRLCQTLSDELHISPLSAQILIDRGICTADEARAFVRPSLEQLHDPFLMKDMDRAEQRLSDAIARHERIMVYGDYDVDGTTAVALMYTFLYPRPLYRRIWYLFSWHRHRSKRGLYADCCARLRYQSSG